METILDPAFINKWYEYAIWCKHNGKPFLAEVIMTYTLKGLGGKQLKMEL